MRLVKASADDNSRLIQFFNQIPVGGTLELHNLRKGSFFNAYRMWGEDHVTYLLLDEQEEIQACASLMFRPGYIGGKLELIGFASDLRVSASRRAILSWSQYFMPVLEQERGLRGCKYVFTVVPHDMSPAYNAFVRPRNLRRHLPRYHLVRPFDVVGLHGFLPGAPKPLPGVTFRRATENDRESICDYIANKNAERDIAFSTKPAELANHLALWPDLAINDFWLAINSEDQMVGCLAPWSDDSIRSYQISKLDARAKTFTETAGFLRWFGLSRRIIQKDQSLKFKYLTFLNVDNGEILWSLLYKAWQNTPRDHFFIYSSFEGDFGRRPSRLHLHSRLSYGLYCILSPTDPVPAFVRHESLGPGPELELPMIL